MSLDKEKEKTKLPSQSKHVPKDAQVIMSIMKELNIVEYEPRVINQLLEFTYRYVTCILDDAKVFANHARKKTIDLDDVRLATEMVLDKSFTSPPPRQVLAKLAEVRNSMPLPPIKPHCGLRLPPDRYCLSSCNYKLRGAYQPKKMTKSALDARSNLKTQGKSGSSPTVGIKRPPPMPARSQIVSVPKPVIKFTTISKPMTNDSKMHIISGNDSKAGIDHDAVTNASAVGSIGGSSKREREEDDFEIVP